VRLDVFSIERLLSARKISGGGKRRRGTLLMLLKKKANNATDREERHLANTGAGVLCCLDQAVRGVQTQDARPIGGSRTKGESRKPAPGG